MILKHMRQALILLCRKIMMATLSHYGFAAINANHPRRKSGKALLIPSVKEPERFSDKLLYLKWHRRAEGASHLVDVYLNYIRSRGLEDTLVLPVGAYESPSKIPVTGSFAAFFIKPSHASGRVLFCHRHDFSFR